MADRDAAQHSLECLVRSFLADSHGLALSLASYQLVEQDHFKQGTFQAFQTLTLLYLGVALSLLLNAELVFAT